MKEGIFKERQVKVFAETKEFLRSLNRRIQSDHFFNFQFEDNLELTTLRRKLLMFFGNPRIPKTEQAL
jgi:hypothetical protein